SNPEALADLGATLSFTETLDIQSRRNSVGFILPNRTNLYLDGESNVSLTNEDDGDNVAIKLLDGKAIIQNDGRLVSFEIGDQVELTLIEGMMGIHFDKENAAAQIECFEGVCSYKLEQNATTSIPSCSGVSLLTDRNQSPELRPADIESFSELGGNFSPIGDECDVAPPTPTFTPTPEPSGPEVIGTSAAGQEIEAYRFGDGGRAVIFVGGIHAGYAPNSVEVMNSAVAHFTVNPEDVPPNVSLYIVPNLNPDSPFRPGAYEGRLNGNGVDLNRNWDCRWVEDAKFGQAIVRKSGGPSVASEPESQALLGLINQTEPQAVLIWGATRTAGGYIAPGYCDKGEKDTSTLLMNIFSEATGYAPTLPPFDPNLDLNGDVSNWLNKEGIPAIFVLPFGFELYNFAKDLEGIKATLNGVSSGTITSEETPTPTPAPTEPVTRSVCSPKASQWMDNIYQQYSPRLGCPITNEASTDGVLQEFEGGTMIWRKDTNRVYVLRNNGTILFRPMNGVNPVGYEETEFHRGAFGYLWFEEPDIQNSLIRPWGAERAAESFSAQDFEFGTILTFVDRGTQRTYVFLSEENQWVEE
ncbi:MAG: M14 family zinc carboxypeptidase, partial [Chloroflexota bacterium]